MPSAPLGRQLLLQGILILICALFSAAEAAITSLSENKLRKEAESRDRRAARLLKLVTEPTRLSAVVQAVVMFFGFLGAAFAAQSFVGRLTAWLTDTCGLTVPSAGTLQVLSVIIVTLLLAFVTLVLGVLVPRRIALKKPESTARLLGGIIAFTAALLKPYLWLQTVSTNAVLRLFRINPRETEEKVSEEEIIQMLDLGEETGAIEPDEKELIENVFAFNDVTASDVMVHRTRTTVIWLDSTPEEILQIITENGYSRIPVCREQIDDVVGILYTREYLLAVQNGLPHSLEELLHPAKFVPESIPAHDLLKEMQRDRTHVAVVVDEFGGVAGIVTMEDILEEIVGEIWDESDEVVEEFIQTGENSYRVLCEMNLEDMLSKFGFAPDEDSDSVSVSGWVTEHFGRIPEQGERFDYENLTIEVLKTDHRQVLEVGVTVHPLRDEPDEE